MNNKTQNTEPIIEVKDLMKSFGDNHVLINFNLVLNKGENLIIMGKSGSGKSVLIKCIIGLEKADGGTIMVMGKKINELDRTTLDELRTEVGFLFQGSALYDSMTVRENLEFPLRRHTKKFGVIKDTTPLVLQALENVGLAHTINLMPAELSGGMKRRIALARTLILQPKVILYDEPTTGLDPITAKEILILMKSIQKKYNTSSIIITHDVDCARVISNRMILLIDGYNYAEGTFEELSISKDPKVQAFFK
ncbi:MAG TPA: ATP-binding cassette domain-containing protein [Flavobacterium sp.]|jgi:phospholipid/cholesterol/gamma-HCH transport system ATP-binding protein|uniref:ABC transporter ATP-binding protein n=1 Tax=Flavobacterium sp. TaxID=239 RepID=UPI001B7345AF|nr:ATP-binding cassette domain-containing protein [Flavobacterium sp.]MBP7181849.1 ATP-binding cassette domain-containing protein [Flavobacterium sp.]MBP7317601.1 ATP-binding cassette domain-containing protein [Flavobacterium sp.]MBP8885878.1 ATP-binding cassette domain-containing protein [Flavobacterium sp.]HRM12669.1 ATP-binding cassette domain-containing protein [Flavobacterium sp.]HRM45027.1 ATP-binding cassette domain-containing protein [Flavobacterium sp.]